MRHLCCSLFALSGFLVAEEDPQAPPPVAPPAQVDVAARLPAIPQQTRGKIVRLFILSGQSNMAGLNPATTFAPALQAAFPQDEILIAKSARGASPIKFWLTDFQRPVDAKPLRKDFEQASGFLYPKLAEEVGKALGNRAVSSVTLVWMQGEQDAFFNWHSVYAANLRALIARIRTDTGRADMQVVIGRLNAFKNGAPGWDGVRAAQVEVAESDPRAAWVDTDGVAVSEKGAVHFAKGVGYDQLGAAFAQAAITLLRRKNEP